MGRGAEAPGRNAGPNDPFRSFDTARIPRDEIVRQIEIARQPGAPPNGCARANNAHAVPGAAQQAPLRLFAGKRGGTGFRTATKN